jgi:hypothetical protein
VNPDQSFSFARNLSIYTSNLYVARNMPKNGVEVEDVQRERNES